MKTLMYVANYHYSMPSSPLSTLVLVRKSTRMRLEAIKGDGTFDSVVLALLDAAPRWATSQPRAALASPRSREPTERRTPAKQALLAQLAQRAWAKKLATGELVEEAPRLLTWTPRGAREEAISIAWPERRGFSP